MAEAALLALAKIASYVACEAAMVAKSKVSNLMEVSYTVQRIRRQFLMMNFFIQKMGASYLSDELLKGWISEVRMLAYHVEDVLDSFSYHSYQFKKDKFLNKIAKGSFYTIVFNELANELIQIEKDIEHVSKLKDMWVHPVTQLVPTEVTISQQQFPRYSFPRLMKDENLFGMENNRQLLKQLLGPEISALTVISVWGMGGMGKTILAINVCECHKEKFNIYVWLTVSQAFSMEALLRKLLLEIRTYQLSTLPDGGSVNQRKRASDDIDNMEVSRLKTNLKDALKKKRFMVVLDDVWDRRAFDEVHDVFPDCKNGSRIVITTRRGDVAALAHHGCQLKLNPLEVKDALLLFCSKAFPNSNDSDCPLKLQELAIDLGKKNKDSSLTKCPPELKGLADDIAKKCKSLTLANCSHIKALACDIVNICEELLEEKLPSERQELANNIVKKCELLPLAKCSLEVQKIAVEIVKKCGGLPLAIVAIGSLLSARMQIEYVWKQIYDQLPCELEKDDQVRGVLTLSYYDLPGELRNCFLYCSMFPEDYLLSREVLVRLWIAEGFVVKKGDSTLEEVAEGYLMELVHRNMLQLVDNDELGRVSTCRMHDILRELALSISKAELFGTANNFSEMAQMSTNVRRLSACQLEQTRHDLSKMQFPHLRTVIALESSVDFVRSILSEPKYLTVLELQGSGINQVPASIGDLFNLRYIGLRNTEVKSLPDSIKKLMNLQTIDAKSTKIEALPSGIVKLYKLRHLLADKLSDETRMEFRYFCGVAAPKGLSRLEELQTLETVEASKELGEQLKKMIQLRNLWIDNIKAEHCAELFASLSKMPLLSSLLLCASDENEKLNIDTLVPTSTILQKLIIRGCTAERTLESQMFRDYGGRLKYLALSRCHLGEDPLEGLASCAPNLTYLSLNKVHSSSAHTLVLPAKSFPVLKTLVLRNMSDVNVLKIGVDALPCIEGLYIVSLSSLKSVPEGIEFLGSLKKLTLLGLHDDFKYDWDMYGMHEKMKHVTDLRV
ncbi:disease resistance protein RPM1-like [Oryza brachyantha]|uniref:NB-ARC domain-containing protein n=1 Tax=Oryza brachyantha TaxID=4533 RepID=J3N6X7_ORYBR|nr:disease resistance protein RPM1-like [Oryza brachyantha]